MTETNERNDMSITATLLKNTAPQSAWLISVKYDVTGETRHAARTSLGAAKKAAVEFANSMGDLSRSRLPWTVDERDDGVQYLRADVDD
jgi:hypothetical protein